MNKTRKTIFEQILKNAKIRAESKYSVCLIIRDVESSRQMPSLFDRSQQWHQLSFHKRSMTTSSNTDTPSVSTNMLAKERSPYLLQHAQNPVNWFTWGRDAFNKAKCEDKPIFLSVGYSTCHWCHVMERESFQNDDVAAVLNRFFVSIKVDREERPDLDKVYMTFVQATTGSGGWPLNVWLTPDLKPIVGGTYFPPAGRYYNKPGFKEVLENIAIQWQEKRHEIDKQGTKILDDLMRGTHMSDVSKPAIPHYQLISNTLLKMFDKNFDEEYGGFGSPPKFPQPVNLNALFQHYYNRQNQDDGARALHMCLLTLNKMANGGIHDNISKGFHRYSTDSNWHVPHFEKMLYDQAQLVVSYMDAYQITKDELYEDFARDIYTYIRRNLTHPEGGFYSAEDADSLPTFSSTAKKEGAFYVWGYKEIQEILNEKLPGNPTHSLADMFSRHYGVVEEGNIDLLHDPHDEFKEKNVLIVSTTLEELAVEFEISLENVMSCLSKSRHILHEARRGRPRPCLDNKMVAAWNGLMISGYARGSQVLSDNSLRDKAILAAMFIRKYLFDPSKSGRLLRSCYTVSQTQNIAQLPNPISGFIDDYAFVIKGLLDLYECCFDDQWLAWAEQLQKVQNVLFWDEEDGGYFTTSSTDSSIVLRLKDFQDGAEPSANAVSARNLLRLAAMLDNEDFRIMAERIFKVFVNKLERVPIAVPELVSALGFYNSKPKQIIIFGEKESADTENLLRIVNRHYLPNKVLLVTDGTSDYLSRKVNIINSLSMRDGKATAYVCEDFTCSLPVNSPQDLEKMLKN